MNDKVNFPANAEPVDLQLLETVKGFEPKSLYWLSGYCSGLADAKSLAEQRAGYSQAELQTQVLQSQPVALKIAVLFASQSGNSEKIAAKLNQALGQHQINTDFLSVAKVKARSLADYQVILLVASTHGEGEPPDDAIALHQALHGKRAPKLANSQHAVLSLGDSSYEHFCQTGIEFDRALTRLGSTRLVERVDCDLDYEQAAENWIQSVVEKVGLLAKQENGAEGSYDPVELPAAVEGWSKARPYTGQIIINQKITGRGSDKVVHHIEIDIADSGISYLPGDSLGIWPKNHPQTVSEILSLTALSGDEIVEFQGGSKSVKQALLENLEITLLNKNFISQYKELLEQAGSEQDKANAKLLGGLIEQTYRDYIQEHQVVDLFKLAPKALDAQTLVNLLKPIKPRMYSIASSQAAVADEIHITVALQKSENENAERFGAASQFLIEQLKEDDEVLLFVEANRHFKLPSADKPIILIGPGTGIAPFRAFLQERAENNAKAPAWLFFGNPHFNTDFLYQVELQDWLADGTLSQLSLAFSRDQAEKIYVQDRLLENAEAVWQWLDGQQASIYVCGDMSRMAKDVESTLLNIIKTQGQLSATDATDYLLSLKQAKRYQRDVY